MWQRVVMKLPILKPNTAEDRAAKVQLNILVIQKIGLKTNVAASRHETPHIEAEYS